MRRTAHARNLVIAFAVVLAILFTSLARPTASNTDALAAPLQQVNFSFDPTSRDIAATPGSTAQAIYTLRNNSQQDLTFTVDIPNLGSVIPGATFDVSPNRTVTIGDGSSQQFTFQVRIPSNASTGIKNLTIQAAQEGTSNTTTAFLNINIQTATSTPTRTNTPTTTAVATVTPGPACPTDANDPGDKPSQARLLLVNLSERHGICFQGDVDWFKFGAVGGKVYTIDVTEMEVGLDLIIELYDTDQQLILTNDDDFSHGTPNPTDLRPRVQSFTAPRDGLYYLRVRDTLNIGGRDSDYTIGVFGESYGPTPETVYRLCRDLYEEDGLPEEATRILPNEIQPNHVLCPDGDADWVKFFAAAGKTYYIYTDTRPHRNNPDFNNQTEAGADTIMYLADRDGVSILDSNDDIAGGGSLDSELRFTPAVDGFYYVQIKNRGDLGNQFIRYDLVLKLCVPGQEDTCNRAGQAVVPTLVPTQQTPGTAVTPAAPTATPPRFVSDEDATATARATQTAAARTTTPTVGAGQGFTELNGQSGSGPVNGMPNLAFTNVWERSDRPIAERQVSRSWMWGPKSLLVRNEAYAQAASGVRQVVYFDKARMEINNPGADQNSPWFVTTGLLVVELITGRMQVGDTDFVQRAAAEIPIAGDQDDRSAPTYASLANVASEATGDRTGQLVDGTINRAGQVGTYSGPQRPETRLVRFVPETGHNIPQVFWDYLNAGGLVYDNGHYQRGTLMNWVFTMGYPISEPFWARVRVGGVERDVLVQAFQRRVLTYLPGNAPGWQVEMGNVGRHYYFWRYGADLPS